MSDTHSLHDQVIVPEGDLLLHAGDFTSRGKENETIAFAEWFKKQPCTHKVVVPGNHDFFSEDRPVLCNEIFKDVHYGICKVVYVDNLQIGLFAYQPRFHDWAFNIDRDSDEMRRLANKLPNDLDILVCHSPPYGILDETTSGENVGCEVLREKILKMPKLKLVVCGHIHESHGIKEVNGVKIVNASVVNRKYQVVNKPIEIEI